MLFRRTPRIAKDFNTILRSFISACTTETPRVIASLFAVLLLGMRHGADPDHLAAIDNLTRRIALTKPLASKFVGTLFASGHTVMVLGIAAGIGMIGRHLGAFGSGLERAGTWLSVLILFVMAGLNLRRLVASRDVAPLGIRAQLLRQCVGDGDSLLVALPIGFLFGLGFETSSQIAAYVMIASGGFGVALCIGLTFCLGMIFTDTCDSILVTRLVGSGNALRASRAWLWTVTLVAVGVAAFETLQLVGIPLAIPELAVSAAIVAGLVGVYAFVALRVSRSPAPSSP